VLLTVFQTNKQKYETNIHRIRSFCLLKFLYYFLSQLNMEHLIFVLSTVNPSTVNPLYLYKYICNLLLTQFTPVKKPILLIISQKMMLYLYAIV